MVVIFLPAAADSGVWQERTGWPSRCTVQAPHSAMPQPNLVPVRPTSSRITHNSGVSASALTVIVLPLICRRVLTGDLLCGGARQEELPGSSTSIGDAAGEVQPGQTLEGSCPALHQRADALRIG